MPYIGLIARLVHMFVQNMLFSFKEAIAQGLMANNVNNQKRLWSPNEKKIIWFTNLKGISKVLVNLTLNARLSTTNVYILETTRPFWSYVFAMKKIPVCCKISGFGNYDLYIVFCSSQASFHQTWQGFNRICHLSLSLTIYTNFFFY